jgi:hypothetical protein
MSIGVTNIKKEHLYEMIQYYGPIYKNKEPVISFGSIDLDNPRRRVYVNHFGYSVPSLQSVKQNMLVLFNSFMNRIHLINQIVIYK